METFTKDELLEALKAERKCAKRSYRDNIGDSMEEYMKGYKDAFTDLIYCIERETVLDSDKANEFFKSLRG